MLHTGDVYTWGSRIPLGLDESPESVSTPRQLLFPSAAQTVVAGWEHALILLSDGSLYGFGYDSFGQLGLGGSGEGKVRESIDGMPAVRLVGAGALHSLAVSSEASELWGFGSNDAGQLSPDGEQLWPTPQRIAFAGMPDPASIVAISGGLSHTLALTLDGEVCSWGSNARGQLGRPVSPSSPYCFQLADEFGILWRATAVASGDHHSLAIASNGQLYAWGRGSGAIGGADDVSRPVRVLGGVKGADGAFVLAAAGGFAHSVVTTSRGEVWAWGENGMGQMGIGCRAVGSGPINATRVIFAHSTFRFWRRQAGVFPVAALPLNMSASRGDYTVSIGGPAAPCRAACEQHGGCGGFSFPAPPSPSRLPSECRFWEEWGSGPPVRWAEGGVLRTRQDAEWELHILETGERGGGARVGTGAEHSMLAAELTRADRCPRNESGHECSGEEKGTCIGGVCQCEMGWRGDNCGIHACEPTCHPTHGSCQLRAASALTVSFLCVCEIGWSGPRCDQPVCVEHDGVTCAGHGVCVISPQEERLCSCYAGWEGEACAIPQCSSTELNSCSNRGWCGCDVGQGGAPQLACADVPDVTNHTQVCTCASAWGGAACNIPCPMHNGLPCGGNGVCREKPPVNGSLFLSTQESSLDTALECVCDTLFDGEACQTELCPGSPNECSGSSRGMCITSSQGSRVCSCFEGFSGDTCSRLTCSGGCSGHVKSLSER